jgi:sortase A
MRDRRIILRGVHGLYHILLWVGTGALALFAWHYFEATYYQAEYEKAFERLETERPRPSSGELNSETDRRPADKESQANEAADSGVLDDLVGRLEIARINLQVMVLKHADAASLRRGAAWIAHTAGPSEFGNMGIAGHRDTHFRPLEQIRKGDRIVLTTVDGERSEYRVDWIAVVSPSQIAVLDPTPNAAVTLVTCYPFDYVGRAPKRFVVRAMRIPSTDQTG